MAVSRTRSGREQRAARRVASRDHGLERLLDAGGVHIAHPSALVGAAGLFDFAGVLAPRVSVGPPARSDAEAIAADWEAVGDALWTAIGAVRAEAGEASEA